MSEILDISYMKVRNVFNRFYPFYAYYTVIRKTEEFSPNFFNIIYLTYTDIFDKKFATGAGFTYSVSGSLNNFGPIWTIFDCKVAHLKDTICAKFYSDTLIDS